MRILPYELWLLEDLIVCECLVWAYVTIKDELDFIVVIIAKVKVGPVIVWVSTEAPFS